MRVAGLSLLILIALFAFPVQAGSWEEAVSAYRAEDYARAIELFRPFAEQGTNAADYKYAAAAQFNLGVMYDNGRGVEEDDVQAFRWFSLAADQGHASAQYNLGTMYADGEGIEANADMAVQWYRRSAEHGHAPAQFNLGAMYVNGEGVPEDYVEGYAWIRLASEQGIGKAADILEKLVESMTHQQFTDAVARSRDYWTKFVVPFLR